MKKKISLLVISALSLICYGATIHPEYTLTIAPDHYIVDFTLPKYQILYDSDDDKLDAQSISSWKDMQDDDCPPFCYIEIDENSDYTDELSYPELPFYAIHLLLPDAATNVKVTFLPNAMTQEYFKEYVHPATAGSTVDQYGNYYDMDTACFNTFYYSHGYDATYPNGFYTQFYDTSNIYNYYKTTGITLSIHPFSYAPQLGLADVLLGGRFIIEFDGGDVVDKIIELQKEQSVESILSQLYYSTFVDLPINSYESNPKYLIVAARSSMDSYLLPYIKYKQQQGYDVKTVYLDKDNMLGVGGQKLADYILYNNGVMKSPDYVLLVGSISDIPAYKGSSKMLNPYTDDPYHSSIGRWLIKYQDWHYPDIDQIINKTKLSEGNYASSNTTAAIFSGIDKLKIRSRWFYKDAKYVAEKCFGRMGLRYSLNDGREATRSDMINDLQRQPHFFFYCGHGYAPDNGDYTNFFTSGIADPYNLTQKMITLLNNGYGNSPMGFGFSCALNTYALDYDNFAARWVAGRCGGVTFYGPTVTTMDCPDRYLSRRIFDTYMDLVYAIGNFPISWLINIGETSYYNSLQTITRKHQALKYNLIGDPTLYVNGRDEMGKVAPFHVQGRDHINIQHKSDKSESVILYDIVGKKIGEYTNFNDIPSGIFIVEQIINGECQYTKISKQ